MPGDRLALAVRVGREIERARALQRLGDRLDLAVAALVGLPVHGEILVRPHAAVLGRQVAHMAEARQHGEVVAEIFVDRLGLGGRIRRRRHPSFCTSSALHRRSGPHGSPAASPRVRPAPVPGGPPSRRPARTGSAAADRQPAVARAQEVQRLGGAPGASSERDSGGASGIGGGFGGRFGQPASGTAGRARGRAGRGGRAGSPARPPRSRQMRALADAGRSMPRQRGSSGEPGTANSSRPASWARRAVIRLPERGAASTTTTPEREPGDDAVAPREMPALRRGAERRFGHDGAALRDLGLQRRVLGRIGPVEPAGDGGDRPPRRQRAAMGGACRCRARGRRPRTRPARASSLGEHGRHGAARWPRRCARPRARRPARASTARSPSTESTGGASSSRASERRIVRLVEEQHGPAEPLQRLDLAFAAAPRGGMRTGAARPPARASPGSAVDGGFGRSR